MTKTVETVHFRVERYILTRQELIAALKTKYGEDRTLSEGRLSSVYCSTLMPHGPDGPETEVVFETQLSEAAEAAPAQIISGFRVPPRACGVQRPL
jgi:hypothetical protein